MQKAAQGEKKRLIWDGVEWPGLVRVGEINMEMGQIDIPGFKIKRKISDGVVTIPAVEATYRIDRDTDTKERIDNWWKNKEIKEGTLIKTDGHGVEHSRQLLTQCEIVKRMEPEYDAEAPKYMQYQIIVLPWDIIDVD